MPVHANQGCNAKEEVWERRSHTKWLHQMVKWAFVYKNFHTGSSCFTVDFWLAVRICASLAHLCGNAFPPHYNPDANWLKMTVATDQTILRTFCKRWERWSRPTKGRLN